ncbi:MAG TPA: S9 family peptidase [Vicinamibacterales bacterium]|jgi:dipeptidyl aminopeptidase/acylaminoacyl peptidase
MKDPRRLLQYAGATLIAASVLMTSPRAQTRRPMTLVDLAELPRLLAPQLSPDGRTLAYFLSAPDWKAGRPVFHLWRKAVEGGVAKQLTFSEGGDIPAPNTLRWSPDGRTLLFLREGQVWLLAADGGEPRTLTHHATGVSAPSWTVDGAAVYFIASDPRTPEERERDRVNGEVYAFDEDTRPRQLWKVTVATGAEAKITTGDTSVLEYRVSTDGTRIALQRAPSTALEDIYRGEAWVMDADGGRAHAVTSNAVDERSLALSPDNSQLLFLADANARLEPYYNTRLFVVPAGGGVPQLLLPDFQYAIDDALWAADGAIVAVVNMGVHAEIFRIDPRSRTATQLTDGEHFIPAIGGGWQVVPEAGKILVQLDEATRFGDVWTLPMTGAPAAPVRITTVFDTMARDVALPRQERFAWKGTDGVPLEGVLFYPIDYQPGTRYPLVVQMHGGPTDSDKFGAGTGLLQNFFPVLAAKGYLVLRPNYRGSSGYSDEFYRDLVGHYFEHMQGDIMTGVDELIRKGIADPDRMVLMGWSAGGHLANKLITMTNRFKAASSGAGVADWISMYGQSDMRASRDVWFGGSPWQKNAPIDVFWNQSPLKDVANATTPTLFFVGENDPRVPLPQSIEMYRALAANHVPTHLYIAPREGHQWGELRHLIYKANVELEWFERYARGRAYVWEEAPH